MDPQHGRQKNVNCDLCENPNHPLYCETCQINLCRACVGNHLLDSSVRHQIIPLEKKDSDLLYFPYVRNIHQSHANSTARNVTCLFVYTALPQVTTRTTK